MTASFTTGDEPPLARLEVLIVDDEALARARLAALVEECPWPPARVAGEAGSAAEALHLLAQRGSAASGRPDALLLDVRMPGLDGLQLAERLRAMERPPAVIFVTAHPEHALRAFDVAAIDYLQKPVRRARLHEALGRIAERRAPAAAAGRRGPERLSGQIADRRPQDAVEEEPRTLVVQDRGRLLRIAAAELLYMKAEAKCVVVRTENATHVVDESLADLQHRLGAGFLRIHRNALVAVCAMRELQKRRADEDSAAGDGADPAEGGDAWWLRVAPVDEWLAVSRRQLQLVKDAMRVAT